MLFEEVPLSSLDNSLERQLVQRVCPHSSSLGTLSPEEEKPFSQTLHRGDAEFDIFDLAFKIFTTMISLSISG